MMSTFEIIFLTCFCAVAFSIPIYLGDGIIHDRDPDWPIEFVAKLFSGLKRRFRLPKRRRFRTWGREFLMLLDKPTRQACLSRIKPIRSPLLVALVIFSLGGPTMICASFYAAMPSANVAMGLGVGFLMLVCESVTLALLTACIRTGILLPAYRQRLHAKALSKREAAIREFNAALPVETYRDEFVPEATSDSLPRLCTLAECNRLPAELLLKHTRVRAAQTELEVAENALAELESQFASQAHGAKSQTTA